MFPGGFVCLLAVVVVADGAHVLTLTDKNFDELLKEKELVLINFYSSAKYVRSREVWPRNCLHWFLRFTC